MDQKITACTLLLSKGIFFIIHLLFVAINGLQTGKRKECVLVCLNY